MIANAPFLEDGTPMPTRYWLVDPELRERVSRLESTGGVHRAEAAVDPAELAAAHARYALDRDELSRPTTMARARAGEWGDPHGGEVPPRALGVVAGRR